MVFVSISGAEETLKWLNFRISNLAKQGVQYVVGQLEQVLGCIETRMQVTGAVCIRA